MKRCVEHLTFTR